MPFDGTLSRQKKRPGDPTGEQSVSVLSLMQSYFGPDGSCCLIGALRRIRRVIRSRADRVPAYLTRAVLERKPAYAIAGGRIEIVSAYNERADSFADIASVLDRAKALAEADVPAPPSDWTPADCMTASCRRAQKRGNGRTAQEAERICICTPPEGRAGFLRRWPNEPVASARARGVADMQAAREQKHGRGMEAPREAKRGHEAIPA